MGAWFVFLFGEKDSVLVREIAKLHKLDEEVVEKHYKEMLKAIEDDKVSTED